MEEGESSFLGIDTLGSLAGLTGSGVNSVSVRTDEGCAGLPEPIPIPKVG